MKLPYDKSFINSHKGLIESFLSLSVLNGLNILLPLITLPYLVRTIGIAKFGAYSIIYTILQYVLLVSTYGFHFTTTKQIAQNKEKIGYISNIFHATIIARFFITLPVLIVGLLFVYFFYSLDYLWMYIGGMGLILGDIINPVWLFQGYEKMRYMTYANLICKLFFTVLIFMFIRSEEDYIYVTLYNSAGYIVAGIITLIISYRLFHLKLIKVSFNDVILQIKDGWSIFLSTIFMNLYRNSNVFILGFFVSEYNVGLYSTAEKVIKAIQSIVAPVSNALFPYLASSFSNDEMSNNARRVLSLNKKLFYVLILLSVAVITMSDVINYLISGGADRKITYLICMMTPVIFIGGMNYILGIVGLVNLDLNNLFLRYVTISGLASLIFLLITVQFGGIYCATISMVIAEIILFFFCYKKINIIARIYR